MSSFIDRCKRDAFEPHREGGDCTWVCDEKAATLTVKYDLTRESEAYGALKFVMGRRGIRYASILAVADYISHVGLRGEADQSLRKEAANSMAKSTEKVMKAAAERIKPTEVKP